jgi:hypothetical protein
MGLKRNNIQWDDALSRVEPTRFEELIGEHYLRQGYRVEHVGANATGQRYDGGVDLKLHRGDEHIVVQCKQWKACQVPHNDVHELIGITATEGATGSILVTTGEFTLAASKAASRHRNMRLIDGTAVRAMLDKASVQHAARVSDARLADRTPMVFNTVKRKPIVRSRSRPYLVPGMVFAGCLIVATGMLRSLAGTASPLTHATNSPLDTLHTQPAGQPIDPLAVAGHVVAARAALAVGDAQMAHEQINDIAHDITRSARIPDVSRPIDHEAARAAVRGLPGVRTALWLDSANFVVMVDGQQHRTMQLIDRVCGALEPLGDTLGVVVNLQDVAAKHADGATTLSRNCQLAEGQRAFLQGTNVAVAHTKAIAGAAE